VYIYRWDRKCFRRWSRLTIDIAVVAICHK